MNIVLLSPYFPDNFYNFAVALRRLGGNVLAIGADSYQQLRPELRDALTEYYRVDKLHDYDQLVRACGYFTHRYGKLDRFESHNEHWLETDARLRTDFNLPGPKSQELAPVKYKSKMKRVFVQAGIQVGRGIVARTPVTARQFIEEVGYPVVAKPDNGVGAAATYKINNVEELARFFAEKPESDYFMEEFISGDLYSFDGLVDQDGKIVFYTVHFFNQGIMEVVNQQLDMYYYSLREIPADLKEAGFRTVEAFGLRERFFHIEFFRREDGLVALEINMRPPGGLTMDMFNYANDIDLYQEWANIVVTQRFESPYTRPYHCAYVGRKGHLNHRLSHEEILRTYAELIVHHQDINPVLAPAIGEYGYLLRSPDVVRLQTAIAGIVALR
ncbi:MAG: ATP-grasp domain-containing protein [Chloroflexota bacterium]|nr:ATP-grasp domain-containing protein [Chloroflexota bacterium]